MQRHANGVILANTASFGTEEVSNHTMMHFLICSRKFVLHDKLVRSGVWTRKNLAPMGHIAGQVFGIVGLGDIGRAVARKAKAFGLQVIAYDPYVASWDALEYGVEMADSLDESVPALRLHQRAHLSQRRRRATSSAARSSR